MLLCQNGPLTSLNLFSSRPYEVTFLITYTVSIFLFWQQMVFGKILVKNGKNVIFVIFQFIHLSKYFLNISLNFDSSNQNQPNWQNKATTWHLQLITGKSLSEALIFASINLQYDNRLFMELKFIYSEKATIFVNSSPYFWLALHRTKVKWRFRKSLWPSQDIWTLTK